MIESTTVLSRSVRGKAGVADRSPWHWDADHRVASKDAPLAARIGKGMADTVVRVAGR